MLIRAATSLLVALGVAAGAGPGCDSTSALTSSGTLTVKIVGFGTSPAPANGGSVSVTTSNVSDNVAFPATLPDSGSASATVPAGDYSITYTPPSGYLLADGQAATQTVHVTGAATTEVDFQVVVASAPTGTLTIRATGLGAGATGGGSADVLRTDLSGQTVQTWPVPASGSIALTILAGTYRITYTPPSGYRVASGVTNPVSGKVVGAGGTATASFAVQAIQTTGTLQVSVTGLTGSPSNGGSAVAQRTDSAGTGIVINISAAGSGSHANVPAGTYTITYTPPNGFQVASGVTNPVTGKVISAGATATVSFAVQVSSSTATLQVNVSGLSGTSTGGIAVAQRTDASGSPITINVSGTTGSGTSSGVPPGTYTVTYTAPSGFAVASGVTNPVTGLAVTAGATATVSFAVTTGGFATPNIINNASFETGWDGFSGSGGNGLPTSVTRDNTRAYDGSYAARFHIAPTPGGDGGGDLWYYLPQSGYDHVWARFYFYFDSNAPNGPFKFNLWWDTSANTQFGGFYVEPSNGMSIQWIFLDDWPSGSGVDLIPLSSLVGGWHSLEVDYWRNGDTSNGGHDYPSAAFWLDGVQISNTGRPPDTGVWMPDGRLNAGHRGSSAKIGFTMYMATLNQGNTATGNVWVDRIAWSSLGRIGP